MNIENFLSAEKSIFLPTRNNPKVHLAIDNPEVTKLSFDLYNPFSAKAKLLKAVAKWFCLHCNALAKVLLPTIAVEKSNFVKYLELRLGKEFISSVYLATEKDKVVLQLQANNIVLGYIKFPLTEEGKNRLLNELNAIAILSKRNLIPALLLQDRYMGTPFLLLQNLVGDIGAVVSPEAYKAVLDSFKKGKSYRLKNHPRILELQKELKEVALNDLIPILAETINNSKDTYLEVYEHGDFAPWNLILTEEGLVPFDFEYFVEVGLEHMDEIKYYFQIAHLLHFKNGKDLIEAVSSNLRIEEFEFLFSIYLIKEIKNLSKAGKTAQLERNLLFLLRE